MPYLKGSCPSCHRRYRLLDGKVDWHVAPGSKTEKCPGSKQRALPETERTFASAAASRMAGVTQYQLVRWSRGGFLDVANRLHGAKSQNRYTVHEVHVAHTMARLLTAGFKDLGLVESLARKHVSDLAVLSAMGYDGDSSTTEHTVGDGIVVTITREFSWVESDSTRT